MQPLRSFFARLSRGFDWVMFGSVILLLALSLAVLFSAILRGGADLRDFWAQLAFAIVGLTFLFSLTFVDYKVFRNLSKLIYWISVILLVFVSVLGHTVWGATRWINLGFFTLQPSELAKVALVFILARTFTQKTSEFVRPFLTSVGYTGLLILLVSTQPDIGTASVLFVIWLAMVFIWGLKFRWFLAMMGVMAVLVPIGWSMLAPYQKERVLTFLEPEKDLLGAGYNVVQAKIAVGSGGLFGRGLGKGPQAQLNFLPVQNTDFIFAAIAEGLGFLGAMLAILLFGILVLRTIRAAYLARDSFGMLVAGGIATFFLWQIFVNIGMNLGLMPVTGIPLPLVSYGGSAILTTLAAIGVLQSIAMRHKSISF